LRTSVALVGRLAQCAFSRRIVAALNGFHRNANIGLCSTAKQQQQGRQSGDRFHARLRTVFGTGDSLQPVATAGLRMKP